MRVGTLIDHLSLNGLARYDETITVACSSDCQKLGNTRQAVYIIVIVGISYSCRVLSSCCMGTRKVQNTKDPVLHKQQHRQPRLVQNSTTQRSTVVVPTRSPSHLKQSKFMSVANLNSGHETHLSFPRNTSSRKELSRVQCTSPALRTRKYSMVMKISMYRKAHKNPSTFVGSTLVPVPTHIM